jgi:predicted nucleic acid binding AN1-type Zn finger protein
MDILPPKQDFTKNVTTTLKDFTKNVTTTLKDINFSKILKKKKKKKCAHDKCNKKLKLTDMDCKCKQRFCSFHRLPETHNCSWDPKNKYEIEIYLKKSGLNQNAAFKKFEQI